MGNNTIVNKGTRINSYVSCPLLRTYVSCILLGTLLLPHPVLIHNYITSTAMYLVQLPARDPVYFPRTSGRQMIAKGS